MDEEKGERVSGPIFKDIRRYFCDHCGICRSKKALITSHILTHHQEKIDSGGKEEEEISSLNECQECGTTFRKPAHLRQHLQSHSLEGSFLFKKISMDVLCEALDPTKRTPKCERLPL